MSRKKAKMSKKKADKKKIQTASIDKQLARALVLTKSKESSRYSIRDIFFNRDTKEIVATDGRSLLVLIAKPSGFFMDIFDLETGLYEIIENRLLRRDVEIKDIIFPKYQDAIPKTNQVCTGNALKGIIDCIIKNQVYIDIWRFEAVLKILNKFNSEWIFTNESPNGPVLMETSTLNYDIKYVMMCYSR